MLDLRFTEKAYVQRGDCEQLYRPLVPPGVQELKGRDQEIARIKVEHLRLLNSKENANIDLKDKIRALQREVNKYKQVR